MTDPKKKKTITDWEDPSYDGIKSWDTGSPIELTLDPALRDIKHSYK